jgi:hypothetical protein
MITGAFDSLTTSIADGTVGFSEILSAITSVGFALPMLAQGLGTVTKALRLNALWESLVAVATKKKTAEDLKATAIEEATAGRKMKAKLMEIGANIGAWISKGPAGWIIAGISAAAIAALGIGLAVSAIGNKKQAAQEEETDNKAIETAEGALEVAEGWNEESQAMDDLIAKHNELKKANDQTIEG